MLSKESIKKSGLPKNNTSKNSVFIFAEQATIMSLLVEVIPPKYWIILQTKHIYQVKVLYLKGDLNYQAICGSLRSKPKTHRHRLKT